MPCIFTMLNSLRILSVVCIFICWAQWHRSIVRQVVTDHVDEKKDIFWSLHDTANLDTLMEDPDLYYEEDTGRWIWAAESTAPRDALSKHSMHAWLHIVVGSDMVDAFVHSFESYLSSYIIQGIDPKRMIVDVHMVRGQMSNESSLALLVDMVEHIGAEYTVSSISHRTSPSNTNHNITELEISTGSRIPGYSLLVASLMSLDGIPLHDWIISVMFGQRVYFGEAIGAIQEFIEMNERNGANCAAASLNVTYGAVPQFVAMKGYLRSNANRSRIFDLQEAEEYFKHSFEYMFTPYHTWWEFYKSDVILGNAYLWYPRASDGINLLIFDMTKT